MCEVCQVRLMGDCGEGCCGGYWICGVDCGVYWQQSKGGVGCGESQEGVLRGVYDCYVLLLLWSVWFYGLVGLWIVMVSVVLDCLQYVNYWLWNFMSFFMKVMLEIRLCMFLKVCGCSYGFCSCVMIFVGLFGLMVICLYWQFMLIVLFLCMICVVLLVRNISSLLLVSMGDVLILMSVLFQVFGVGEYIGLVLVVFGVQWIRLLLVVQQIVFLLKYIYYFLCICWGMMILVFDQLNLWGFMVLKVLKLLNSGLCLVQVCRLVDVVRYSWVLCWFQFVQVRQYVLLISVMCGFLYLYCLYFLEGERIGVFLWVNVILFWDWVRLMWEMMLLVCVWYSRIILLLFMSVVGLYRFVDFQLVLCGCRIGLFVQGVNGLRGKEVLVNMDVFLISF